MEPVTGVDLGISWNIHTGSRPQVSEVLTVARRRSQYPKKRFVTYQLNARGDYAVRAYGNYLASKRIALQAPSIADFRMPKEPHYGLSARPIYGLLMNTWGGFLDLVLTSVDRRKNSGNPHALPA